MSQTKEVLSLLEQLSRPLLLTILIESTVGMFLLRKWSYLPTIVLMNCMTNPMLNLLVTLLCYVFSIPYLPLVIVLEIVVVFTEAILLSVLNKIPYKNAGVLSLVLNSCSYLIGVILFH